RRPPRGPSPERGRAGPPRAPPAPRRPRQGAHRAGRLASSRRRPRPPALVIRPAAPSDNAAIAAIWNREVLETAATTDTEPRSLAGAVRGPGFRPCRPRAPGRRQARRLARRDHAAAHDGGACHDGGPDMAPRPPDGSERPGIAGGAPRAPRASRALVVCVALT